MLKLILRYLMMVTPPLLGVLVLLELGRGLTPPVSVKGAWSLDLGTPAAVDSACGNLEFSHLPPTLTIVQSGPQLELALNDVNKTALTGEIRASSITAEGTEQGGKTLTVRFEAEADPQAIPDRLVGQVSFTRCSVPVAIAFTAMRQKAAEGQ